jgi:hypothetical protein
MDADKIVIHRMKCNRGGVVLDPWRADPNYEIPPVELWLLPLKEQSGTIIEAWNEKRVA